MSAPTLTGSSSLVVDPLTLTPSPLDANAQARVLRKDKPVKSPVLELRGGVVTAVDIAAGEVTIRLGGSDTDVPNVPHVSNYVPTVDDSVKVLVAGKTMYVLDRITNAGPSVISQVQQSSVTAEDFTTDTLYNFLPNGPTLSNVRVGPSGRLLVQISSLAYSQQANTLAMMGVLLSHQEYAFQVNPLAVNSQIVYSFSSTGLGVAASKVIMFTDLPPGLYTAQTVYVSSSGNACYFSNRHIWAMPL